MIPFLVLVALCVFGPKILAKARRADYTEYHLLHGPHDGCVECSTK